MNKPQDEETHADELRAWAKGMHAIEAATELLIRGGYAQDWRPWVREDAPRGGHWIAFENISESIGGLSGGQQRFLRIAASLGADVPIILADEISGIDRKHLVLVLSAISHAHGSHVSGRAVGMIDGTPQIVGTDALAPWPSSTTD